MRIDIRTSIPKSGTRSGGVIRIRGRAPSGYLRGRLSWLLSFFASVVILIAQFAPNTTIAGERAPYRLGRGLPLGETGVTVGGYASIKYADLANSPWKAEVSDLSLFLSWDSGGRWRAFSEMEIGEAITANASDISTDSAIFELERTYVDRLGANGVNFRFGKFLTPVGHWNQVHADPLVWTVSRPLTTRAAFANHATGAMLYGDRDFGEGQLDFQLYLDDSNDLDPEKDKRSPPLELGAFDNAVGGRLVYHSPDTRWQIGFSAVDFKARHLAERWRIGGLDFLWKANGYELGGELVTRFDSSGAWSAFLQGVAPIAKRWYLVDRYEEFDQLGFDGHVATNTLGIVFRPKPALSLKLEYVNGNGVAGLSEDGFLASAAVLF